MIVIGLTGGIASGKTTASDYFTTKGAHIIDTDEIAREVVLPETPAFQAICNRFEDRVLHPDHSLNRDALRQIIFNNPDDKQWLESLLHPLIRQHVNNTLNTLQKATDIPYCIVVIPLLSDKTAYPMLDRILVIDVPVALQKERLATRHQYDDALINNIIASQPSRDQRLTIADDIIENNRDTNHLVRQLERLHYQYRKLK